MPIGQERPRDLGMTSRCAYERSVVNPLSCMIASVVCGKIGERCWGSDGRKLVSSPRHSSSRRCRSVRMLGVVTTITPPTAKRAVAARRRLQGASTCSSVSTIKTRSTGGRSLRKSRASPTCNSTSSARSAESQGMTSMPTSSRGEHLSRIERRSSPLPHPMSSHLNPGSGRACSSAESRVEDEEMPSESHCVACGVASDEVGMLMSINHPGRRRTRKKSTA